MLHRAAKIKYSNLIKSQLGKIIHRIFRNFTNFYLFTLYRNLHTFSPETVHYFTNKFQGERFLEISMEMYITQRERGEVL